MYIFEILENECVRKGLDPLNMPFDDIVNEAGGVIFDFDYDIYDKDYKPVLEQKFFLRNYEKQIGYETIFGFKRALRSKLLEILPKYNNLYELDEKKLDFFIGQVSSEDFTKSRDDTNRMDSKDGTERETGNERELATDNSSDIRTGQTDEECNKNEAVEKINTTNVASGKDVTKNKDMRTYTDRPENKDGTKLAYATNTTYDNDEETETYGRVDKTGTDTGSKSSAGTKKAQAKLQQVKGKTETGEKMKELSKSDRLYSSTNKFDRFENYVINRTNNNADGMISRITAYVKKIKPTDELVLDELDIIFSSIWGW